MASSQSQDESDSDRSSNSFSSARLNVPSSRLIHHQPPIASPLRENVITTHNASDGSEEATPTQTPAASSTDLRPSLSGNSMASRAHAYYEAWKDGSSNWTSTPSGSSPSLPLHHSPPKPFKIDSRQNVDQNYFPSLPSDSNNTSQADQSGNPRWNLTSQPSFRQNLVPSDAEVRADGLEARRGSFNSITGSINQNAAGYASSVEAEFQSAPPSRLVSRTPTPINHSIASIPRISSPDNGASTDSDDEDSDYYHLGNAPSGWGATLFGFKGRNNNGTLRNYRNSKADYHPLGMRSNSKMGSRRSDLTFTAGEEVDEVRGGKDYLDRMSSKGFDRGGHHHIVDDHVSIRDANRKRYRRRRQKASSMSSSSKIPNPIRALFSVLSKSFRTCFGPIHPLTVFIALIFIAGFVTSVTMVIMYILNPDKEPLPWRTYCQQQMPFPHQYADALAPVNVVVGVMTIDSKYERRNVIRNTYGRHTLPIDKNGRPLANVQVKFILGRVRKAHAKRIALEMETYNDIVVLDMDETQSARKTLTFFQWAAENATVPFLRPVGLAKDFKGNLTDTFVPSSHAPGGLANWDYDKISMKNDEFQQSSDVPLSLNENDDSEKMRYQIAWKKVDYVVKADDDTFIVLSELERHLRVAPRKMTYWGYLVKNWFMGGEAYALSYDLVHWLAGSSEASRTAKGKEDTRTPQWLAMHPNRSSINWVSEHCWIYDHPKGNSPYSHGFLFPDYVEKMKLEARHGLSEQEIAYRGGERRAQSYSTVSKWHQKYSPPRNDLTVEEELEALVEGGGRWEGAWVRKPDGSSSETWVPIDDIVYANDDIRLRPSSTNERGNAVLASDVGLEMYSGLPIYGPVASSNISSTTQMRDTNVKVKDEVQERDLLSALSSLPRKLVGLSSTSDEKRQKDTSTLSSSSTPFEHNNLRFLPKPTPKEEYGDWASLHARRYLNKPYGGTVIVHYLKKTEYWHETALILLGKAKLWENGAGGLGKEWRMGGSPLIRSSGYITEGRSAPKRANLPVIPEEN